MKLLKRNELMLFELIKTTGIIEVSYLNILIINSIVFLKRFEEIELINDTGPLAIRVKSVELKLESSEHARDIMERDIIEKVAEAKIDVRNCQQKQSRMLEVMNTYDKQQDSKNKDILKIKKQVEFNTENFHLLINELKINQESVGFANLI